MAAEVERLAGSHLLAEVDRLIDDLDAESQRACRAFDAARRDLLRWNSAA